MNHTRRIFRLNIGFLINQTVGTLREMPFEMDACTLEDDFKVENLNGVISLARTQNGIRALGDFRAQTEIECGRCLEPYQQALHTEFEEIFTFENWPLSEDVETVPEDGYIDFEPYIREYLMLEIPYTPVCRADCLGLCIICGQNLNDKDCGHAQSLPAAEDELIVKLSNQKSKK